MTESATSLLDVMRQEVIRLGINVEVSTEVKKIKQADNKYYLECNEKTIEADYVVLATGGKASPALGSNGSGYNLLKNYLIHLFYQKQRNNEFLVPMLSLIPYSYQYHQIYRRKSIYNYLQKK